MALKKERLVLGTLPNTLAELTALPQAGQTTPFETAALTVAALCAYPKDKEAALEMLDYLRGPRPLNGMEKQFIADRFRDSDYVPRSYLEGATPANDYAPSTPYAVSVQENDYSYTEAGYARLLIASGGADSPRPLTFRLAKDGRWYLWEQSLLVGIRQPESKNPWA